MAKKGFAVDFVAGSGCHGVFESRQPTAGPVALNCGNHFAECMTAGVDRA
jgi:hypothetical protein